MKHWTRGGRPALMIALAALIAACDEAPVEPTLELEGSAPETVISESSLNQAASEVSDRASDLTRDAERDRQRDPARPQIDRVGFVVQIAGTSVDLAKRILHDYGADAEQRRLLEKAEALYRAAHAALAAGDIERAVALSIETCWTALKAVVLPGGVTEEEIRMIHELAKELLTEAVGHVGDAPTPLEKLLLDWSYQFYVTGEQQVESGQPRGVAWLWKSAVVSAYILER